MLRQIIKIDEDKCNGCGLCASACHEGAISVINGKAKLLRDDYCDGLGNCLPVCPTGAITFERRDTLAYDEAAVEAKMKEKENGNATTASTPVSSPSPAPVPAPTLACGCPSTTAKMFNRTNAAAQSGSQTHANDAAPAASCAAATPPDAKAESCLRQWPVQIKLVPVNAPYFKDAHLLIAADCTAYAHASFNQTFMKNKITLIGCPKLDDVDYSEKFTAILANNSIKSVTVVRMEVPCCGGISAAAMNALKNCGKMIPWNIVTLATDGSILED